MLDDPVEMSNIRRCLFTGSMTSIMASPAVMYAARIFVDISTGTSASTSAGESEDLLLPV